MNAFLDAAIPANLSPWVALLFSMFIKGSLVLAAIGLLVYGLQRSSAAVRYLVWSTGLLSLMALPFLSTLLPQWNVGLFPQTEALIQENPAPVVVSPEPDTGVVTVPGEAVVVVPVPAETPVVVVVPPQPAEAPASPLVVIPEVAVPPVPVEPGPTDAAPAAPVLTATAENGVAGFNKHWTTWVFLVWMAGMLGVMLRLVVAHAGVHLLVSRADYVHDEDWHDVSERITRRLGINKLVRLRWSKWTAVPLSVGIVRPTIVLPEQAMNWDATRRETVLLHELVHVKRRDCLIQLLAQITCAIHWFNPLVWVAIRQLRIERERACDDMVLMAGTRASSYAETLLETARSLNTAEWSTMAALAMARRSQLEGRLLAILDPNLRARSLNRAGSVLALMLVASIVLPLAALHPAQAQKAESDTVVLAEPVPDAPAAEPEVWVPEGVAPAPAIAPEEDASRVIAPEADTGWDVESSVDVEPLVGVGVEAEVHPAPAIAPEEIPDLPWDHNFDWRLEAAVNPEYALYAGTDLNSDLVTTVVSSDTLTIEQLIQLSKYGVDAEFIRNLKDLGFDDLSFEELVVLAKYGADPEYIRDMQAAGFPDLTVRDIVGMSKYGVDPEFVEAMGRAGFSDLSVDEIITLSKYGADEEFIAEMGAAGLTNLSVDDLVSMSKYGVDADLIVSLRNAGYGDLSADDLVTMSKYGVDPHFIDAMQKHGYSNLSVDGLVSMSKYG
ncbi:MAG: M56 family metallopeptidase, partial [Rhodothermales bacterium]